MAFIFHFSTKYVTEEGDNPVRTCERCHSSTVKKTKSQLWCEPCCIPLCVVKSKNLYRCSKCKWKVEQDAETAPPLAGLVAREQEGYPANDMVVKPAQ